MCSKPTAGEMLSSVLNLFTNDRGSVAISFRSCTSLINEERTVLTTQDLSRARILQIKN